MQKLTIIMLAFVAMIATACGSKYNEETCDTDDMLTHYNTMYYELSNADLKGENKTNFKELEKLNKEVDRLWERTRKKVNRLDD